MQASDKQLIKYFRELYNIEKGARDLYNDFLAELRDEKEIVQIRKIRDDEEKHMKIVEQIIEIISSKS